LNCLECHSEKGGDAFKASIHGSLDCNSCHTDIKAFPHPDKVQKVNCGTCHAAAPPALAKSVHTHSSEQPCLSCHGDAHEILPASDPKSSVYPLNVPRTCGKCHGDKKVTAQHNITEVYSQYMDSIHGFALTNDGLLVAATCSGCHGSHDIRKHTDPASKVFRANIPDTCGKCHSGVEATYHTGIHGMLTKNGDTSAPVCSDCHTAHQIANVQSAAWQVKTTATCGNCHKEEMTTYRDTFHSQVSSLEYKQVARCWDCHGEHDILPASDPKSKIADANLIATCGRCHQGANASFVTYQPHADPHDGKRFPALHVSAIFMNLLLAGVIGFFLLHTILWLVRSASDNKHATGTERRPQ
jgi:DnaJ-class molecular chaperone